MATRKPWPVTPSPMSTPEPTTWGSSCSPRLGRTSWPTTKLLPRCSCRHASGTEGEEQRTLGVEAGNGICCQLDVFPGVHPDDRPPAVVVDRRQDVAGVLPHHLVDVDRVRIPLLV